MSLIDVKKEKKKRFIIIFLFSNLFSFNIINLNFPYKFYNVLFDG